MEIGTDDVTTNTQSRLSVLHCSGLRYGGSMKTGFAYSSTNLVKGYRFATLIVLSVMAYRCAHIILFIYLIFKI